MAVHSEHSSYREKLLEHLFIGAVLRHLWCQGITSAEFLRPEVDNGGYDLEIASNTVIRYIQLEVLIQDVTGVQVLSLQHDISTISGEEVVLFTLTEPPLSRQAKNP